MVTSSLITALKDLLPWAIYNDGVLTDGEINKAIQKTQAYRDKLTRLRNYYDGKHDILLRQYTDASKPNNRIVMNYCEQIADFYQSYIVGEPIEYGNISDTILETFDRTDEPEQSFRNALYLNIYGAAAEIIYPGVYGTRFAAIDPREIIPIYNTTIEAVQVGAIRLYKVGEETYIDYYTERKLKTWRFENGTMSFLHEKVHGFKGCPVIYYKAQKGVFEQLMGLQDAINKLTSDTTNDHETIVDSLLVIPGHMNTDPDEVQRMKQNRVLLVDATTKPYWLEKTADRSLGTGLLDRFVSMIKEKSGLLDMKDLGTFGASGRSIQFKLTITDIVATSLERALTAGIRQRLKVLGGTGKETIEFYRNFIIEEGVDDYVNQRNSV